MLRLSFFLSWLMYQPPTQPASPRVGNLVQSMASPTPPPSSLQVLSTVTSSFAKLETVTSPVLRTLPSHCGLDAQCPHSRAFSPLPFCLPAEGGLSNCEIFLLGNPSDSLSVVLSLDQPFDLSLHF